MLSVQTKLHYDWANFIQSGTLRKLAVKELNKYTEFDRMS